MATNASRRLSAPKDGAATPPGGRGSAGLLIAAGWLAAAAVPAAQGSAPHHLAATALRKWPSEPVTLVLLVASAAVYAIGVRALWRRAGYGRGLRPWQAAAFGAGLLVLAAALLSPLVWLSSILFSAHMTQHELLMLVAAPLLVIGQPLLAALWALPGRLRERASAVTRARPVVSTWRRLTAPLTVFLLHGAVLWIWHVPVLFEAAMADSVVHAVQHFTFLITAALFWWGMIHGRFGRMAYGAAVLYVFLTAVHSSVLGALMTVAPTVWYPAYETAGAAWHVNPLEDQQVAGLVMWVPSGVLFIVLGLALFAAWLGESERRARLGSVHTKGVAVLLLAGSLISGCGGDVGREVREMTGGDPERGKSAIGKYGCASCHTIPGIDRATARVGPPLDRIAGRTYLAGHLPNTPANMVKWVQHPQQVEPGTAMPEMGVTEQDARDISAYLYTLR